MKMKLIVTAANRLRAPMPMPASRLRFMNVSLVSMGGLFITLLSSGSATKVAEAARSMKSSRTIIWIGAKGRGTPRAMGNRKLATSAILQAKY